MINKDHPSYKDLTSDDSLSISYLHTVREYIEVLAERDIVQAIKLYPLWEQVQCTLQRLWGFKEDKSKIRFWKYPGCTCPKVDNEELYETKFSYMNAECPLHEELIKHDSPN